MLYSKLFGKTKKEAPKDETSRNAQLLIQAGFIHKEMAGVYTYLPLGLRTLNKICNILREEMNAIGGQEAALTALQEKELWEKTGRWDDNVVDVWFKTKLKGGSDLGLGLTHEEPLTQIATKYVQSYRDLPFYVYQIQNKFRNEVRSKSGLMRGREFLMKDLYSFNKSQQDLDEFYNLAIQAYKNYFNRIGLGEITYVTFASGGIFTKYSHEFQTLTPAGEDTVFVDRKKGIAVNKEVYSDEVLADLNLNKDELEEITAAETGNIFKLGTKFSEPLGLTYIDEDGNNKHVVMGSYGIGPGRSMGVVVEVFNDERGIIWPENIAPYKVHLVGLNLENDATRTKAGNIYDLLSKAGIEVLFDDRVDTTAGEKFANADLIGCPYRLVVSNKTVEDNVEMKMRRSGEVSVLDFQKALKKLLP